MKKNIIRIILCVMLLGLSFFISNSIIKIGLLLFGYFIIEYDVLFMSFKNIIRGCVFDEHFLMSVATIGAICINECVEALCVMLFYQIGELFSDYAVDKSRESISDLMGIKTMYANLCLDNDVVIVDPKEVKVNDVIVVKPGEKISLDGTVIEGDSMIDTSSITGESVPRKVCVGDSVLSGCVNVNGVIKIRVTSIFSDSTVSKILELLENSNDKKSNSERFITKFAKFYTPCIVIISLLLFLIPSFIFKFDYSIWLYRALSFLVVSCPCALVISIPLSFFGGIGACSRCGVLVKGSNYLEKISDVDTIICDKTGTLTEGVFEVVSCSSVTNEDDLFMYASYGEYYSNHPISFAIRDYYSKDIDSNCISEYNEISGHGVCSYVFGKRVLVGNDKLMDINNICYVKNDSAGSVCYVSVDDKFIGSIVVSDRIKDDSYAAIELFRNNGIKNIIMLTGDREISANYVKDELGIDKCYFELLPNDKVSIVNDLVDNGKNVLFVGDGINDAPVLKLSSIGVSMGGIGSDAAISASDIVIMDDKLSKINNTINISRRTKGIVYENIVFAIFVKILILILCGVGITGMWEAIFADVGVTVLSVLNSLRLLRIRK